jgi:hypothetical protein
MERKCNRMAQIGKCIPNKMTYHGSHAGSDVRVRNELKELVKIAYGNRVATMDWRDAGSILTIDRTDDGDVVINETNDA